MLESVSTHYTATLQQKHSISIYSSDVWSLYQHTVLPHCSRSTVSVYTAAIHGVCINTLYCHTAAEAQYQYIQQRCQTHYTATLQYQHMQYQYIQQRCQTPNIFARWHINRNCRSIICNYNCQGSYITPIYSNNNCTCMTELALH